jgi:signal transduction histidine kinase
MTSAALAEAGRAATEALALSDRNTGEALAFAATETKEALELSDRNAGDALARARDTTLELQGALSSLTQIVDKAEAEKVMAKAQAAVEDLLVQRKQAEDASRQRFLQYLMHEVRVPFNSVYLALTVLQEQEVCLLANPNNPTNPTILLILLTLRTLSTH